MFCENINFTIETNSESVQIQSSYVVCQILFAARNWTLDIDIYAYLLNVYSIQRKKNTCKKNSGHCTQLAFISFLWNQKTDCEFELTVWFEYWTNMGLNPASGNFSLILKLRLKISRSNADHFRKANWRE